MLNSYFITTLFYDQPKGIYIIVKKAEDKKMDDKEMTEVTVEEALRMEIILNQALTDILIEKGLITEEELLARIDIVKKEME